jgi:subtilisin family serine protease
MFNVGSQSKSEKEIGTMKRKLIIELAHNLDIEKTYTSLQGFNAGTSPKAALPKVGQIKLDEEYGVVQIPSVKKVDPFASDTDSKAYASNDVKVDLSPAASSYIVRTEVDEKILDKTVADLMKEGGVKGVFADVAIQPSLICAGSSPRGTDADVEKLLCAKNMRTNGMTGKGVFVAIVDTGINMAYLNTKGKNPSINLYWSWKPASSTITLGSAPVGHGTMCAFDVAIAAPDCTLLDIALLSLVGSTTPIMSGVLSDAIKAYEHLMKFMNRRMLAGENRSLVVNNSWGMFHPSWDFPVGHPGNFSSNINHPFNVIVGALAGKGADILFAAGNCGPECPDSRCQGVTDQGIYGANSHPAVTSVTGIGTNLERVGYSNMGPGRLTTNKPDITGYTHFDGSGVFAADGGTSAATPVVTGVVAAIRTVRPLNSSITRRPAAIRNILRTTATDIGTTGYDFMYGFGLINGCGIVKKLFPFVRFCDKYPHICEALKDKGKLTNICKANPKLCLKLRKEIPHFPPDIDPEVIRYIKEFDTIKQPTTAPLDEIEMELSQLDAKQENLDENDGTCCCNEE